MTCNPILRIAILFSLITPAILGAQSHPDPYCFEQLPKQGGVYRANVPVTMEYYADEPPFIPTRNVIARWSGGGVSGNIYFREDSRTDTSLVFLLAGSYSMDRDHFISDPLDPFLCVKAFSVVDGLVATSRTLTLSATERGGAPDIALTGSNSYYFATEEYARWAGAARTVTNTGDAPLVIDAIFSPIQNGRFDIEPIVCEWPIELGPGESFTLEFDYRVLNKQYLDYNNILDVPYVISTNVPGKELYAGSLRLQKRDLGENFHGLIPEEEIIRGRADCAGICQDLNGDGIVDTGDLLMTLLGAMPE